MRLFVKGASSLHICLVLLACSFVGQIVRERVQQQSAMAGLKRNMLGTVCLLIVVTLYRDESNTYLLQKSVQAALLPLVDEQQALMDSRGSGEHQVFWQWLRDTFMPVVLPDEESGNSEEESPNESFIRTYNKMTVSSVRITCEMSCTEPV